MPAVGITLHLRAQNDVNNVACCQEPILCPLAEGKFQVVSDFLIIQCYKPSSTQLVSREPLSAHKVQHPASNWLCTSCAMSFWLCSNFWGSHPAVFKRVIQIQVQPTIATTWPWRTALRLFCWTMKDSSLCTTWSSAQSWRSLVVLSIACWVASSSGASLWWRPSSSHVLVP